MSILDVTYGFSDLSQFLRIALDLANYLTRTSPENAITLIRWTSDRYIASAERKRQTVATRLIFSQLNTLLALLRLESEKNVSLVEIRSAVYHEIPVIHELNFLVLLVRAGKFSEAIFLIKELAPIFLEQKGDPRLLLAYYELACLANLGGHEYSRALDILDSGYKLCSTLDRTSLQVRRFITFFEKVIEIFDELPAGQKTLVNGIPLDSLIVPGLIFDKDFLSEKFSTNPLSVLVEMSFQDVLQAEVPTDWLSS